MTMATLETVVALSSGLGHMGIWPLGVPPSFHPLCHKASLPAPQSGKYSQDTNITHSRLLYCLLFSGPQLQLICLKVQSTHSTQGRHCDTAQLREGSPTKLECASLERPHVPGSLCPAWLRETLSLWPSLGSRPECSCLWTFNQGALGK